MGRYGGRYRARLAPYRLALVAVVALSLAGCGATQSPQASGQQSGGSQPSGGTASTLVIGADISDILTLDPEKEFTYTSPIPSHVVYETLVTMSPGDYQNVKPLLATSWEQADNGNAWVFHLRQNVKFANGDPLTADDVKFSFDRLKNLQVDPSALAENIASVDVVDPSTVKITMVDKTQPLLPWLISPVFGIADAKVVAAHGGLSTADAATKDSAQAWLDENSAGSGPYVMTSWVHNGEIDLSRNPNYWGDAPAYDKVIIRNVPNSATQVQQLQRGDIDIALNLTYDQVQGVKSDSNIQIIKGQSMDFLYLALTASPALSKPLSNQAARQAVLYSIDYKGIIDSLLGGDAIRPLSFIPVGLGGSTTDLNDQFGYSQDLTKAKQLLQQAGYPNGFSFDLTYPTGGAVAGLGYDVVAQTIQSNLAQVGIQVKLVPQEPSAARTAYKAGKLAATLSFWNPDAMDPGLWADATVNRVAARMNWTPPQSLMQVVKTADTATDPSQRTAGYVEYQKEMAQQAILQVLMQPIYSVAARTNITGLNLTAAGWQFDIATIAPKG